MPDRYIEKSFLWLLAVSLLLHLGLFLLLAYLPPAKQSLPQEPVFLDLQEMPELNKQLPAPPTPRLSERRMRTEREMAPRGSDSRDSRPMQMPAPALSPPRTQQAPVSRPTVQPAPGEMALPARPSLPPAAGRREPQVPSGSSATSLLKPRQQQNAPATAKPQLFPGAGRLAKLEESYRRKFESDVAEGDTRFLNTDDIQFGSFLRRFENSVYGVWRYPQEAARNGVEGITPIKITFNRRGEIVRTQLLESSGSTILDDEVLRTLRLIGPVGGFPRGYDKEEFHLIAFFQYGMTRKSLR